MPKSAPPITSSNPFRRTLSTPGDTTPNHTPGTVPPLPHFSPALVAAALASSSAVADGDVSPTREAVTPTLARSLSVKTLPESPSNPFLRRTSHSPAPPPVRSQSPPLLPRRPPLPPRGESNITMLPPPRHPQQPAKPPKPSASSKPKSVLMPAGGAPSELIKQSLRAAKGAQRANETSLEKQRTWEVIKSSTQHSSSSNSGGVAQALAQLTASNLRTLAPGAHVLAGPSSSTSSSLDRVAAARPDPLPPLPPKPASHQGHSRTPNVVRVTESPAPGRPTRSKSMHHSPSQTPPPDSPIQPPPRRRPESIQFNGSGRPKQRTASPSPNPSSASLSRRTSLVRSHTLYEEVRRRAGELEPKLDAVRAKAEGKMTSRGYMTRRGMGEQGEPLVDVADKTGDNSVEGDMDWREWERDDDQARRYRQSPTRGLDVDRDVTTDHGSSGWRQLAD
jgi:hypothetical protein